MKRRCRLVYTGPRTGGGGVWGGLSAASFLSWNQCAVVILPCVSLTSLTADHAIMVTADILTEIMTTQQMWKRGERLRTGVSCLLLGCGRMTDGSVRDLRSCDEQMVTGRCFGSRPKFQSHVCKYLAATSCKYCLLLCTLFCFIHIWGICRV